MQISTVARIITTQVNPFDPLKDGLHLIGLRVWIKGTGIWVINYLQLILTTLVH